jgi:hypothetical protein
VSLNWGTQKLVSLKFFKHFGYSKKQRLAESLVVRISQNFPIVLQNYTTYLLLEPINVTAKASKPEKKYTGLSKRNLKAKL